MYRLLYPGTCVTVPSSGGQFSLRPCPAHSKGGKAELQSHEVTTTKSYRADHVCHAGVASPNGESLWSGKGSPAWVWGWVSFQMSWWPPFPFRSELNFLLTNYGGRLPRRE